MVNLKVGKEFNLAFSYVSESLLHSTGHFILGVQGWFYFGVPA